MTDDALKVGDRIKDNDPRMYSGNRVLSIVEIHPEHVLAKQERGPYYGPYRIQRKRIYTDDKPRRSGFSVVRESKA